MGVIREGAGIIEDLITGKGLAGVAWKYVSIMGEEWMRKESEQKKSVFGGQKSKRKKVIEDVKREYQSIILAPQTVKDLLQQAGELYQYGFGKHADEDDEDEDEDEDEYEYFPTVRKKINGGSNGGTIVIKAVPFFLIYDYMYSTNTVRHSFCQSAKGNNNAKK